MHWENALHPFAVADAAHRKSFVYPMPPAPDHNAGKNLDAFLVAFYDLGMDAHRVANAKFRGVLAVLFRFNFIKYCLVHKITKFTAGLACVRSFGAEPALRASGRSPRGRPKAVHPALSCRENPLAACTADTPAVHD